MMRNYGPAQGRCYTLAALHPCASEGTTNTPIYSLSFLTGTANLQSEFAKSALKIQASTSSYNIFTKSFSFSEAKGFLKASKVAEKLAKKFGVASALFTLAEGASDGNLSTGDVAKAAIGLLATFGGPLGVLYTAVDLGVAIFSEDHKGLTDRIGEAIDKKLE